MEIGGRFISIHATAKGYHGMIKLPNEACVYDVFGREAIGKGSEFKLEMQPFGTRLFFLGSEYEVKSLDGELSKRDNSFRWK